MEIIVSEENILLAYRNIKKNKGSKTKGTNKKTIIDVGEHEPQKLVEYVRNRLANYKPHSVRRVLISKPDGGKRPLGIPTIEDRLIQQCIKQVIEPICEAKFYKHSYGFRPNRSTHHAIARAFHNVNATGLHFVVDIDIKGFFDNVNHGKLLKQMWSLGIQDKALLSVISKLLKAEIKGEGIPTKGTPQGGIISPLLSNIGLNELDWWICNQWEKFPTRHKYKETDNRKSSNNHKIEALKRTNLKEMYIVRYADDFKIFCRNRETANTVFEATKKWLKDRLELEISENKSSITNLRKKSTDFLGIKFKAVKKGKKKVCHSWVSDKAKEKAKEKLRKVIRKFSSLSHEALYEFNATVLGLHNYYRIASHVFTSFEEISFSLLRTLQSRTYRVRGSTGKKSKTFLKYYGRFKNYKPYYIEGIALYPIYGVVCKTPRNFSQEICNYTAEGREYIHNKLLGVNEKTLEYLMRNPVQGRSAEFNDNRISLYVAQKGECAITKEPLMIGSMHVHHKVPTSKSGTDEYSNLTLVNEIIHRLIHATKEETIQSLLKKRMLEPKALSKLNKLRKLVGNHELI